MQVSGYQYQQTSNPLPRSLPTAPQPTCAVRPIHGEAAAAATMVSRALAGPGIQMTRKSLDPREVIWALNKAPYLLERILMYASLIVWGL